MLKDYHELLISFTRSKDTTQKEERYQATVRQKGLLGEGGTFERQQKNQVRMVDVREVQKEYERLLRDYQELAPCGMRVNPPDSQRLLNLGHRVAAVLPEQTRNSVKRALRYARESGRSLRIILEFDQNALALLGVPWELLALSQTTTTLAASDAQPVGNAPVRPEAASSTATDANPVAAAATPTWAADFVLLRSNVSLVRQVRGIGEARPLDLTRPSLRLQAFVAQPKGAQPIDAQSVKETVKMIGASAGLYDGNDTLVTMQERLRQQTPEIVHILCHGEHSDDGRVMRNDLLFTHGDDLPRRVSVFELVPTLSLAKELQLVVLHACYSATLTSNSGAQTDEKTAETPRLVSESIALGVLRAGVRVVVAFQGEVGQETATAFMTTFYQRLSDGCSIDQAVAEARIAMQANAGSADWSLPVVYRGHAEPETATPLTRLADQVEIWLADPRSMWTTRAGMIGLALLLLLVGVIRWVLLPPVPLPLQRADLQPLLMVWFVLGLLSPAIIAAMHRGVRLRQDLTGKLRQQARMSQWTGAYLGYMIWNMVGLASGAILVLLDLSGLTATRGVQIGWLVVTVVSSWFVSYVIARRMVKSCLALAPYNPELFDLRSQWILFVGVLLIQGIPLAGVWTDNPEAAWFLHPVNASFIFAIGFLSIAYWLLREVN